MIRFIHTGHQESHPENIDTIDLLNAPSVILRQLEVVRLHPLIKGSHDGQRVVGVLQTQGVAQLVDRHQEQVITWVDDVEKIRVSGGIVNDYSQNFFTTH